MRSPDQSWCPRPPDLPWPLINSLPRFPETKCALSASCVSVSSRSQSRPVILCSALVGAWSARVTPRLRRPARVTPRLRRPAQSHPTSPSTCQSTPRLVDLPESPPHTPPKPKSPSDLPESTPRLRSTCQSHPTSPSTCQSHPTSPSTLPESPHVSVFDLPESPHVSVDLPESHHVSVDLPELTPRLRRPARVTPRLRLTCQESPHVSVDLPESPPVSADLPESPHVSADLPESPHVSADLPESPHVSADLPESPHVSADLPESPHGHSSLPSVTSRLCCLLRPALVGSCLIGPHGPGPPFPPPVPPPLHPTLLEYALCKRLEAALWGGGSVRNLVTTHSTAHHPWTTSPIMHCTHTFPSTITPITQLSPFTHQPWLPHHTCTSFTHSHKSSTQTLTHCEVLFCPGWHSERYSSCPSLCLTPDCPTLELWTCACDLDPCLVLFTSLLCLWYSCFCLLTIARLFLPLLIKHLAASESTRLRPVITIIQTVGSQRNVLTFLFCLMYIVQSVHGIQIISSWII